MANHHHPATQVVHVIEAFSDEVSCCSHDKLPIIARPLQLVAPAPGRAARDQEDIVWRSRRQMLQMLETRFEQKQQARTTTAASTSTNKQEDSPPPQSPSSTTSSLAAAASLDSNKDLLATLEAMLFATATTFEDYMDETTLDLRLRNLFIAVLTRRLNDRQKQKQHSSSRRSRTCKRR